MLLLGDVGNYEWGGFCQNEKRKTMLIIPSINDKNEKVEIIGEDSFSYESEIETVFIEEGITTIDRSAFYNCKNLKKIFLPSTVDTIEQNAFSECISLEEFVVAPENKYFSSIDGVLFTDNNEILVKYPENKPGETYIIHNDIKTIYEMAFYCNQTLKYIAIPKSVKKLGKGAFHKTSLKNVIFLGTYIEYISKWCFMDSKDLECCVLPKTIDYIESFAFSNCYKLHDVTLPTSCSIEQHAFKDCHSLSHIKLGINTIVDKDSFSSCIGITTATIAFRYDCLTHLIESCPRLSKIILPLHEIDAKDVRFYEIFGKDRKFNFLWTNESITAEESERFGKNVDFLRKFKNFTVSSS